MSCEVLLQAICANNHLFEDGYYNPELPENCPRCEAGWIWNREWDVTNFSAPDEQMAREIIPTMAVPPPHKAEVKMNDDWEATHWERRYPLTADGKNYVRMAVYRTTPAIERDRYRWLLENREGKQVAWGEETFFSHALRAVELALDREIEATVAGAEAVIAELVGSQKVEGA